MIETIRNSPEFSKDLEREIAQKVDQGIRDAIDVYYLNGLCSELGKMKDGPDRMIKENELKEIMKASSVLVNTLPEFNELLKQVASIVRADQEWVQDILSHENAHANVATKTGHEWGGYAVLFIKNNGRLSSLQPMFLYSAQDSWGEVEKLLKRIEVNRAPEVYNQMLSTGHSDGHGVRDNEAVLRDRARLKELENDHGNEIARVKGGLELE